MTPYPLQEDTPSGLVAKVITTLLDSPHGQRAIAPDELDDRLFFASNP
jgi:hypothetical protein